MKNLDISITDLDFLDAIGGIAAIIGIAGFFSKNEILLIPSIAIIVILYFHEHYWPQPRGDPFIKSLIDSEIVTKPSIVQKLGYFIGLDQPLLFELEKNVNNFRFRLSKSLTTETSQTDMDRTRHMRKCYEEMIKSFSKNGKKLNKDEKNKVRVLIFEEWKKTTDLCHSEKEKVKSSFVEGCKNSNSESASN